MRGVIIKTVVIIFLIIVLSVPVHIPSFHSRTSVPLIYASPPRSGAGAGGGGGEGNGNISITGPVAMGISDLGYDSNGSYSYYTSSVLGSITIYKAETSPVNSSFSVQLNSVVTFNSSGERYSYWVQDVAIINPYIHFVTFIDNIWNYSNVHYSIFASSVTGNGQIYNYLSSEYYGYGIAPFSISYPVTISMKMVTSN
ncbi:MAG: thermopsin family protease, partial [Candidatus Parvarchaeota archaeon]